MKYIKPEIEINIIHTEDVITASGFFNWIVNSGNESADENSKPSVSVGKENDATINVGADFFG